MPFFSKLSLARLATAHPELQLLFNEVIKEMDCTVIEGYRDEAAQEAAFKAKKSKLHYPFGKHNSTPSSAVDIAPFPIDWQDTQRFLFFAGFVLGVAFKLREQGLMKHKIRWGGDWNSNKVFSDETFVDLVHYEIIL